VIVTTHSPNLTAAIGAGHVVAVRRPSTTPTTQVVAPAPASVLPSTIAIPVQELGLGDERLAKINRYLDVTRCGLLFSRRVMLVEGLAEALLIPALAEKHVLNQQPAALSRFRATALIPIGGVDFDPYVELLLKTLDGSRIADKVVVVTDEDGDAARCVLLHEQSVRLAADSRLAVFSAKQTLEAELYAAGNQELLRSVFLEIRPKSEHRWEELATQPSTGQPAAFVKLIGDTQTRKGDFAQILAYRIATGSSFSVPSYLADAIKSSAAEVAGATP